MPSFGGSLPGFLLAPASKLHCSVPLGSVVREFVGCGLDWTVRTSRRPNRYLVCALLTYKVYLPSSVREKAIATVSEPQPPTVVVLVLYVLTAAAPCFHFVPALPLI